MTSEPFPDCVAIDTNVWVHLVNPQHDDEDHIFKLLDYIRRREIQLIEDDKDVIAKEYQRSVPRHYRRLDETRNERYLLRYCLNAPRRVVVLDESDDLMQAIGVVIFEPDKLADRTFVYVALKLGRILISNDTRDIVRGPLSERPPRRDRLLEITAGIRPEGADILTSMEAYGKI